MAHPKQYDYDALDESIPSLPLDPRERLRLVLTLPEPIIPDIRKHHRLFSDSEAALVKAMLLDGYPSHVIARHFGVQQAVVRFLKSGLTYRDVPPLPSLPPDLPPRGSFGGASARLLTVPEMTIALTRIADGEPLSRVAFAFGVPNRLLEQACSGQTYKGIPVPRPIPTHERSSPRKPTDSTADPSLTDFLARHG